MANSSEDKRDDAIMIRPRPGAYLCESTRTRADYWLNNGRDLHDRAEAIMAVEQSVNAWMNLAYALAEKLHYAGYDPQQGCVPSATRPLDYHTSELVAWLRKEEDIYRHCDDKQSFKFRDAADIIEGKAVPSHEQPIRYRATLKFDHETRVIEGTIPSSIDSRLEDALDDVKRLHEEKMKFFERVIELERDLAYWMPKERPQYGAPGSRDVDVAEAQRKWDAFHSGTRSAIEPIKEKP